MVRKEYEIIDDCEIDYFKQLCEISTRQGAIKSDEIDDFDSLFWIGSFLNLEIHLAYNLYEGVKLIVFEPSDLCASRKNKILHFISTLKSVGSLPKPRL